MKYNYALIFYLSPSLTRSMTHNKMTESVAATSPVALSPSPSLPPNPLHCHHTQTTTIPLPQSYNHSPAAAPTSSSFLPNLSVPIQAISSAASYSLPLALNRSTNCKGSGSHVTSQEDHMMSHMILRRRDLQLPSVQPVLATTLNDRLVRPKIRGQIVTNGNCTLPAGIRRLSQLPAVSKQDEPVLKTSNSSMTTSRPTRNLRYRPYSHGKT